MSGQAWPEEAREAVADALSGWPIGSGYYATSMGTDEAHEAADAVLAALSIHAVPRAAVLDLADAHSHEPEFDCTERCDGRQEVAAELRALAGGDQ